MDIIDFKQLAPPDSTAPDPDKLISGDPRQQICNAYSDPDGRFHVGRWTSSPGTWRVRYTEIELCHILAGRIRLRDDSGVEKMFGAGDTFMINRGFSGSWEVLEACTKIYAIYE